MISDIIKMIGKADPEIEKALSLELNRQKNGIELIASENFVSEAVMLTMGSPLTNKYAEGYPGKRYYGGCEYVDVVETFAIERAKEFANDEVELVQEIGCNIWKLLEKMMNYSE